MGNAMIPREDEEGKAEATSEVGNLRMTIERAAAKKPARQEIVDRSSHLADYLKEYKGSPTYLTIISHHHYSESEIPSFHIQPPFDHFAVLSVPNMRYFTIAAALAGVALANPVDLAPRQAQCITEQCLSVLGSASCLTNTGLNLPGALTCVFSLAGGVSSVCPCLDCVTPLVRTAINLIGGCP
ncbi:hypothetical protein BKA66DRAFT_441967 [Pyrenochaeta sp. MPI-SDFR-AT-0127]|nr:hypothetical protein BKA66DRAFT_441967 [Pyrenochaeta sp. MPI-SDFR-AT-0127]